MYSPCSGASCGCWLQTRHRCCVCRQRGVESRPAVLLACCASDSSTIEPWLRRLRPNDVRQAATIRRVWHRLRLWVMAGEPTTVLAVLVLVLVPVAVPLPPVVVTARIPLLEASQRHWAPTVCRCQPSCGF